MNSQQFRPQMANPPYIQQTSQGPPLCEVPSAWQAGRAGGAPSVNSIPLEFPTAAVQSLTTSLLQPQPHPDSASSRLSSGFAEKTRVIQPEVSIVLSTSESPHISLPSLPSFYSVSKEKGWLLPLWMADPFPWVLDPILSYLLWGFPSSRKSTLLWLTPHSPHPHNHPRFQG